MSAHSPPRLPRAIAIPAAERRLHAVQGLLELARDRAPEAISTAAIAERMGGSHGALFRHFPSREALWAEAVLWAVAELEERFDRCAEAAAPLSTLRALMASHNVPPGSEAQGTGLRKASAACDRADSAHPRAACPGRECWRLRGARTRSSGQSDQDRGHSPAQVGAAAHAQRPSTGLAGATARRHHAGEAPVAAAAATGAIGADLRDPLSHDASS